MDSLELDKISFEQRDFRYESWRPKRLLQGDIAKLGSYFISTVNYGFKARPPDQEDKFVKQGSKQATEAGLLTAYRTLLNRLVIQKNDLNKLPEFIFLLKNPSRSSTTPSRSTSPAFVTREFFEKSPYNSVDNKDGEDLGDNKTWEDLGISVERQHLNLLDKLWDKFGKEYLDKAPGRESFFLGTVLRVGHFLENKKVLLCGSSHGGFFF